MLGLGLQINKLKGLINPQLISNRKDFPNTNGWLDARENSTISVTDNAIRSTGINNSTSGTSIAFDTVVGTNYIFSIEIEKSAGDTMFARIWDDKDINGTNTFNQSTSNDSLIINNATFTATSTTSYIGVICVNRDTGEWVQVKSVSVKKQ